MTAAMVVARGYHMRRSYCCAVGMNEEVGDRFCLPAGNFKHRDSLNTPLRLVTGWIQVV